MNPHRSLVVGVALTLALLASASPATASAERQRLGIFGGHRP